jgi:hypothetical protein
LNDNWSAFNNQAGLGRLTDISAGVYYENKFLINSFSTGAMAAALPTKSGTFGLSVYSFSTGTYKEAKYGLAYGTRLGEKLCAGLQLNYISTVLPENYGRFNGFSAELGVQAKLTEKDNLEYVPTVIRIGLQYLFSEKVFFATEVQKDIDHPIVFRAATEYHPNEKLFLRMGIATNPGNYSFGFGYKMKTLSVDVAASYHQILGFTPQIGFNWGIGAKLKNKSAVW